MARRRLTDEQVAEAVRLRERGWGCASIGKRLGVSAGAILYQCLKQGAVSPRTRSTRVCDDEFVAWGGRRCRRFTPAEDARISALRTAGTSAAEISRLVGRAPTSVRIRLLQLALRDEAKAA